MERSGNHVFASCLEKCHGRHFSRSPQVGWTGGADNHDFGFVYASGGETNLTLDFPATGLTDVSLSDTNTFGPGLNTLAIRSRALAKSSESDPTSALSNLALTVGGSTVDLASFTSLTGASDAQYLVITGLDLSAGFSLTGTADFDVGNNQDGSRVMYQAKVGTVVPIPAAAWLFGSSLLGMAGIGYRKSRMA